MLEQIIEIFADNRFIVQPTSFDHMDIRDEVKAVIRELQPDDTCAALLFFFPQVFIYPRQIEPAVGCYLGVFANPNGQLPQEQRNIVEGRMPTERVLVFWLENGSVHCRRYNNPQESLLIQQFIDSLN